PAADPQAAYGRVGALLAGHRLDDASLACAVAAFHRAGNPPRRLAPGAPHPLGTIVGLCARFDDLTTARPGRAALPAGRALAVAANGPPLVEPELVELMA